MTIILDERQTETRQRLVDAAFELFDAHGFDNVTAAEIARAAGVSRRTFFRYFPAKEKVIFPFTDERIELFRQVMRSTLNGRRPQLDDVVIVFKGIIQNWYDNKDRMLRGHRIVDRSETLKAYNLVVSMRWEHALAQEIDIAMGRGGDDVSPTLRSSIVASVILGSFRPVLRRWYECEGEFDLMTVGVRALEVGTAGLFDLGDEFDV